MTTQKAIEKINGMLNMWSHIVYDEPSARYTDGGDIEITADDIDNILSSRVELIPVTDDRVKEVVGVIAANSGLDGIRDTLGEPTSAIARWKDEEGCDHYLLVYDD